MNYNLNKFKDAHEFNYKNALSEIKNGRKRSHWIWYIFPQIAGLGMSQMSQRYAIQDLNEAKAYLDDNFLKNHLDEICAALLELDSNNATEIMGVPDDMKLKSSMTLFAEASRDKNNNIYQKVLDKFFNGEKDNMTLDILEKAL